MYLSFIFVLFANFRYPINTNDGSGVKSGILYGRYQSDTYAGGNPWILITAALASLFYRGASYINKHGVPSAQALSVWQQAFSSPTALPTTASALAQVFAAQGMFVSLLK